MKAPSRTQILAAVETLMSAGWSISPPAMERIQLLDPHQVAEAIGCGLPRAREIITSLPNSVRIPGGELRARPTDLEAWIEGRRIGA
jgi:hypothetical protein